MLGWFVGQVLKQTQGKANPGVVNKLLKTALTKGTLYPFVKSVCDWFGKKITKQVFAQFFQKTITIAGGVIGGTITYLSFKPCCEKLKESLQSTILSSPSQEILDDNIEIK